MITPEKAAQFAEATLVEYDRLCEVQSPDDLLAVLATLIAKSARSIEKYNGNGAAVLVLHRTTLHLYPQGTPQ